MGSEAREKLYEKVQCDTDFAKLICSDFDAETLVGLIKPNKILEARCLPFMKKGRIANKNAIINEISNHAKSNSTLSKIIMLTWLEKNKTTVKFIETNVTKSVLNDLHAGKFGDYKKIEILSRIDNRQGAKAIYDNFFELNKPSTEETLDKTSSDTAEDNSNVELQNALNRIKALEDALETVKQTNKEQKNLLEQKTKELASATSNLAEKRKIAENLQEENSKLASSINNLKTRLEYAEQENKKFVSMLNQASSGNNEDLSSNYETVSKENSQLKTALSNKNSALKRIESENEELKKQLKSSENSDKTISNLREKLRQAEINSDLTQIAGQIADSNLFVTVYGDPYVIPDNLTKEIKAISEEFALLCVNSENIPQKLISLENKEKREIIGTLKSDQGNFFIENEEERIQIYVPVTVKQIGKPAKGIILPEIASRPEGIYSVISLSDKTVAIVSENQNTKSVLKDKEKNNKDEAPTTQFNGEKLLIIGGDRVGHEYERILSKHNLQVIWRSGFESISDLRKGLCGYNAVVIIIKQLSHTLLREITASAKKDGIPIIYSSRRGISGVLAELSQHFPNV